MHHVIVLFVTTKLKEVDAIKVATDALLPVCSTVASCTEAVEVDPRGDCEPSELEIIAKKPATISRNPSITMN